MHNFSAIVTELGAHDKRAGPLRRRQRSASSAASPTRTRTSPRRSSCCPATLQSGNTALAKIDKLGRSMESTFTNLRPTAQGARPDAEAASRRSSPRRAPVIRDAAAPVHRGGAADRRELRRPAQRAREGDAGPRDVHRGPQRAVQRAGLRPARARARTATSSTCPGRTTTPTRRSPRRTASAPLRRGLIMISCAQLTGARAAVRAATSGGEVRNPYLSTLIQLLNAPSFAERLREGRARSDQASSPPVPDLRDGRLRHGVRRRAALPLALLRRRRPAALRGLPLPGPLPGGDPAGRAVRRPHLRRPGRQGHQDRDRARQHDRGDARDALALRAGRLERAGDAAPEVAARRDLRRPDDRRPLEGHGRRRRSLADAAVAPTVELDEIFRTFDDDTQQAFQTWMQSQASAVDGRGADINADFGNLPEFVEAGDDILAELNAQSRAVSQHDPRHRRCSSTRSALAMGSLRGLITESNRLFQVTAARNREFAAIWEELPEFSRQSRLTLPRLTQLRRDGRPGRQAAAAGGDRVRRRRSSSSTASARQFEGFFERARPADHEVATRRAGAREPARRTSRRCSPTSSPSCGTSTRCSHTSVRTGARSRRSSAT